MVSKKDDENLFDALRRGADRFDTDNPVIDERWSVEEVTPPYNTGGYYDTDVPERSVVVGGYFQTEYGAKAWLDKHEADKGKYLRIRHEKLRRYTYTKWGIV